MKPLKELTFKDNFMFAAIMSDPANAKGVLERILGKQIQTVKVETEKTFIYNPEYKGVRLDVFLSDENGTRFNVEMQVANQKILKRARYYHAQMDMDVLKSGKHYEELPESYVIFICDYDPIGLGKYVYTVRQTLQEESEFEYDNGIRTIFLSTKGNNANEVDPALIEFLKFAGAELEESRQKSDDTLVQQLQNSAEQIRIDREMGEHYMLMDILMRDQYEAGLEEGREGLRDVIISILEAKDLLTEDIQKSIGFIQDIETLKALTVIASKVNSANEFERELSQIEK